MICVTLGNATHTEMIAAHGALAERGVQLVELRLDLLDERPDVARLFAERPCPVIVTCRRPEDGGKFRGSEQDRRALLSEAIDAGAEYVDLELDTSAAMPRRGAAHRIVSYHNFDQTPENLEHIHAELAACDADIVKVATMATRPADWVRMLRLVSESGIPTAGFCMGEIGLPSRILTGKYGAPFTYAAADEASAVAPGQISFENLRDLFRYDKIGPHTQVYGVIGDPIAHSLSPLIHNAAFDSLGLDKVYLPFRVPPEALAAFLHDAVWLEVCGLSVTIPHKEAVRACLDGADATVEATGAANTIVRRGGKWRGYNSDCPAAIESLQQAGDARPKTTFDGKQVLVLGAGGAARAIVCGLKEQGANVTIASRTLSRARSLAEQMGCESIPWQQRGRTEADILVNATPLGMFPQTDAIPIEADALRPPLIVFDTVYNPESTQLIREARQRGCTCVTGLEMFVRQAALQFQWFTGFKAPLEQMRELTRKALRK